MKARNNSRKLMRLLPVAIIIIALAAIATNTVLLLIEFALVLALGLLILALAIAVRKYGWIDRAIEKFFALLDSEGRKSKPIPPYQPPTPTAEQPGVEPRPYQRGYRSSPRRAQTAPKSASRSENYEQAMAQYPEQPPPPQIQ